LAKFGAIVYAIEISKVASKNFLKKLKNDFGEIEKEIEYSEGFLELKNGTIACDYNKNFSFEKEKFDIVLDITSSNALSLKERDVYLDEVSKVLKNDGYFFVRVPAKDENAKKMIKNFPAFSETGEKDSYIIPELGITETVFTEETFRERYGKNFKILKLTKEKHYTKANDKVYKRYFIIAYLQKK
jgi:SAM-dependent methyltransferase